MISIIVTTYKEKGTLPKCLTAILTDIRNSEEFVISRKTFEVLVVGPDEETASVAQQFSLADPRIKYIKDEHRGKPAALNLALEQARGEIFILTDGDVWIKDGALKKLIIPLTCPDIGAVTGHPLPINLKNNIFGYWAHFLTNAAHQMRLQTKIFPCSGYLYAFRKNLIHHIPEDILSEDGWITQQIREQKYAIAYAPDAIVYVKYPNNFHDWLLQKNRSTGGYVQRKQLRQERNIIKEISGGIKLFFTYPKSLKEFYWTKLLYLSRLYLWLLIFWQIKIRKYSLKKIWQRIESTK